MINTKQSFPDRVLWNNWLTVCDAAVVRSSNASSFNNVSLWTLHDTVPRLQNKMLWIILKHDPGCHKLSTCSLRWDPSDICTQTWIRYLNRTCQSNRSFTSFVLTTDSNMWTVSESERASVYFIQCRQDISSDCNFYFLLIGFRSPPNTVKHFRAHFRLAFYCGQPKAHLCNNHAV